MRIGTSRIPRIPFISLHPIRVRRCRGTRRLWLERKFRRDAANGWSKSDDYGLEPDAHSDDARHQRAHRHCRVGAAARRTSGCDHDSEFTRALESITAGPATPSGPGTSGKEWWPTNWHYFVMPESLKEALRSDGTAFEVLGTLILSPESSSIRTASRDTRSLSAWHRKRSATRRLRR